MQRGNPNKTIELDLSQNSHNTGKEEHEDGLDPMQDAPWDPIIPELEMEEYVPTKASQLAKDESTADEHKDEPIGLESMEDVAQEDAKKHGENEKITAVKFTNSPGSAFTFIKPMPRRLERSKSILKISESIIEDNDSNNKNSNIRFSLSNSQSNNKKEPPKLDSVKKTLK